MKRHHQLALAALFSAAASFAQLTMQQRVDDFNYLAGVLDRQHASYVWKQQVLGFDMLNTKPWVERVRNAKDDFEFYDICSEYVASLRDAYTFLQLPSDFEAYLGFTTDLTDDKAIVESIDRLQLPASRYDIAVGDELVSVDGVPMAKILAEYGKYGVEGNQRAMDRFAADFATYRPQFYVPRAGELGDKATVVLRKATSGDTVTLEIPWDKIGTPMKVGPVPDFKGAVKRAAASFLETRELLQLFRPATKRQLHDRAGRTSTADAGAVTPEINAITVAPIFNLPSNFVRRLGGGRTDLIYSGSYESGGKRVGFLRVPSPSTSTGFVAQIDAEVTWLQANTDVLVLDVMRDNFTSICAAERVAARFVGREFTQPGFALRATLSNILSYELNLEQFKQLGAPPEITGFLEDVLRALRAAYEQNRGMTGPIPGCDIALENRPVVRDRAGALIAYTKPVLLLTDEMSYDFIPAILQDEARATQFGSRTRGLVGLGTAVPVGAFSEMYLAVKDGVMVRTKSVKNPGYPDGPYVENAGVHPQIPMEYRTKENRDSKGAPFVEAFTKAALALVP